MSLSLKTKKPLSVFLRTVILIPASIYHSHPDAIIPEMLFSDNDERILIIY